VTPLRLDLTAEKELARALALHNTPAIGATGKSTHARRKNRSAKKKRKFESAAR